MSRRLSVLILDDDIQQAKLLAEAITRMGHQPHTSQAPEEALERLKQQGFHLVITDLRMPGMDGLTFLRQVKEFDPETEVLLVTAFASVASAVEAIKVGALDYFEKPVNLSWLAGKIAAIEEKVSLRAENRQLKAELARVFPELKVIGKHPVFLSALSQVEKAARSDAPVLLQGESGTGKEILARFLHLSSRRAKNSFIPVNCGAIPEPLVESEFFGHVKGAFTGADKARPGRIEDADTGTLFLDEIGELPLSLQPKLLRVIQSGEFSRVGANKLQKADIRWVSATNKHLDDMVKKGMFREDLFYRLAVIPVEVPPLRNRPDDIPLFVAEQLHKMAVSYKAPAKQLSRKAMQALESYSWPGNIRELESLIERLFFLVPDEIIEVADLPREFGDFVEPGEPTDPNSLQEKVNNLEKQCILEALKDGRGNQSEAARQLGINERTLRYKMKRLGIPSANTSG
jgi:DNA-binding NtrC family response regulator